MKVQCSTIADFLSNLRAVGQGRVFGGVVYWSVNRTPLDGDRKSAVRWDVVVQASAVVAEDSGEYLLEAAEDCGRDYLDSSQDCSGSDQARRLGDIVVAFCRELGLTVRPGVVSE